MNQIDSNYTGETYDKPVEFTVEDMEIIYKVLKKIPMNLIDHSFESILKLMPKVSRKICELSDKEKQNGE